MPLMQRKTRVARGSYGRNVGLTKTARKNERRKKARFAAASRKVNQQIAARARRRRQKRNGRAS